MKRFVVMVALVLCSSLVSAQNTITCSIEESVPIIRTLELKGPGDYTFVLSSESDYDWRTRDTFSAISEAMRVLPEGYNITLDCINVRGLQENEPITRGDYGKSKSASALSYLNDIDSLVGIILPPSLKYADDFLNGCKNLTKVFNSGNDNNTAYLQGIPKRKSSHCGWQSPLYLGQNREIHHVQGRKATLSCPRESGCR